jgi:large repetitive protein
MRHHLSRLVRPRLEPLEGREVPAGNVTATLVGGRLTLTGDDQGNGLTLLVTHTDVTVTPDATTSVNGQPAGTAVPLPGAATSLAANLAGGDDSLSIDQNNNFALAGAATVNLGDGGNILNLTTGQHIALGSLAVTSGPGSNTVIVSSGTGLGTVAGAASLAFGPGGTNTVSLGNTSFTGPTGVRVTVGVGGSNFVNVTGVTVARTLSVNVGRAAGGLQTFVNDTLGGLALTGAVPNFNLTSTTINGNLSNVGTSRVSGTTTDVMVTGSVTMREGSGASLTASGIFTAGNVTLVSGGTSSLSVPGTFTVGNVTLTSRGSASTSSLTGSGTVTAGNVTLTSGGTSTLAPSGTFKARNVSVSGPDSGRFQATGTSATITGNLSVTSRGSPFLIFGTSALSEVTGNVTEGGGGLGTTFTVNGNFQADRNVTVTTAANNSSSSVAIGDTAAPAAIKGNLTVSTGNGPSEMTLTNLTVGGLTRVTTVAGADTLTIDRSTFQGAFTANTGAGADTLAIDGTTFKAAFTANTGAGNDTFDIAQLSGMPGPVTFAGRAMINAGPGDDTLRLGRTGVANAVAVFDVPTSLLNGGPGLNTFFETTSNFTGLTPANFVNWTNA